MPNTIHGAFHIPVASGQQPTINWNLANHDIVQLEEISIVASPIIHHLNSVRQLAVHPVVVYSGDDFQEQPIDRGQLDCTGEQAYSRTEAFVPSPSPCSPHNNTGVTIHGRRTCSVTCDTGRQRRSSYVNCRRDACCIRLGSQTSSAWLTQSNRSCTPPSSPSLTMPSTQPIG